jgi:Na+/melibiose symporter-like transporter
MKKGLLSTWKENRLIYTNGIGMFGLYLFTGFVFQQSTIFLTDIAKLSIVAVGIIDVGSRLIRTFLSPIVGGLIDRFEFKSGKYSPWLKLGSIIFAGAWMILYAIPAFFSARNALITLLIVFFYIAANTLQQIVTTANTSFFSDITNDPKERTTASTFRNFGREGGKFVGGILFPLMLVAFTNMWTEEIAYFNTITAFAIIMIGSFFLLSMEIKKYIKNESAIVIKKKAKPPLKLVLKALFTNVPLMLLFIASVAIACRTMIAGPLNAYYFKYVAQDMGMFSVYNGFVRPIALISIALAPFTIKLVGDSKRVMVIFALLTGLSTMLVKVIPGIPGFFIAMGISTFTINVLNVVSFTLYAAAVDYSFWKNGIKNPGLIMGVKAMTIQVALIIATTVRTVMLQAIGFKGGMPPSPELSAGIINIFFASGVIVLIGAVASALLPFNDKKIAQVQKELLERESAVQ